MPGTRRRAHQTRPRHPGLHNATRRTAASAAILAALATAGCGTDDPVPTAAAPTAADTTTTFPSATAPSAPAAPARPGTAAPPAAAEPTVDPYAGSPLIDHTEWTADADGRRLHVYPTPAGRDDQFPTALDRAWGEIVADAPDADAPGMYDQFRCHWVWARLVAPDKTSWNLEPWRPVVGYAGTVDAMCNPGGPDPAGN